jgi:hypothetical protein
MGCREVAKLLFFPSSLRDEMDFWDGGPGTLSPANFHHRSAVEKLARFNPGPKCCA